MLNYMNFNLNKTFVISSKNFIIQQTFQYFLLIIIKYDKYLIIKYF